MPNPGSFHGARKAFLISQKAEYAAAVKDHNAAEALSHILRRFFKRFPIDLPDDFEPSETQLAAVDDNAPDPVLSDHGTTTESDSDLEIQSAGPSARNGKKKKKNKKAKKTSKSRKKRIEFRRAQIKRWMSYQYAKDNTAEEKENGAFNPYKIFLPRFVGDLQPNPPRRKPAFNIWRKTKRTEINDELQVQVERAKATGNPILPSHFAARREAIARTLYNELTADEKKPWETKADEAHELAMIQHKQQQEEKISTAPADRQRAIQRLPGFIKPILDLICEVTGWKVTIIAGGPEPALQGEFSIISVHSGTTNGPVPMNFGRAQRTEYQKSIVPIFGKFLQQSYDQEECESWALNPQEGFMSMSESIQMDETEPEADRSASVYNPEQRPLPLTAIVPPLATVETAQEANEWDVQETQDAEKEDSTHVEDEEEESGEENGEEASDKDFQIADEEDQDEGNDSPFPFTLRVSPHAPPSCNSLPPTPASSPNMTPVPLSPTNPVANVGTHSSTTVTPQTSASTPPVPIVGGVTDRIPSSATPRASAGVVDPLPPSSTVVTASNPTPSLKIFIPSLKKKPKTSSSTSASVLNSNTSASNSTQAKKRKRAPKGNSNPRTAVAMQPTEVDSGGDNVGGSLPKKRQRTKSAKALAMEGR